jgi:hypothetical protein
MYIQRISRIILELKAKGPKDGPHQDGILKWEIGRAHVW